MPAALAEPIEVRDAFDRTVRLPAPPQRIVTIFASNTEIVSALGLADRIVGIEAYTRWPPDVLDKPLVGGRLGFSVDMIVAQRPDLVVVTPARQAVDQLLEPLSRIGVPVIVLLHRSVAEVIANIRLVARATGVPARGEEVATRLEMRLAGVRQKIAGLDAPSTVMITGRVGNGLLLIARPGTYTSNAIELAGGRLAFDRMNLIAQISPEAIVAASPDVLLFAGPDSALQELIARPGWQDMQAVRMRRAHTVSRAQFLIPGPRTVDGIEALAALLRRSAGGT